MKIYRLGFMLMAGMLGVGLLAAGLSMTSAISLAAPQGAVLFVDLNAPGPVEDGATWASAFQDLQSALDAAVAGDEIWVAQGVYTPNSAPDRTATFNLKKGVAIYGGFGGYAVGETLRTQRDFRQRLTVLSGDLDGNDTTDANGVTETASGIVGSNAYHVVASQLVTETAVLDGFTITGGNANGSWPHDSGGGLRNVQASPTLANLSFVGNAATQGGGLYNDSSPAVYVSALFGDNANPGSRTSPRQTIASGIARAQALGYPLVRIQAGNYNEVVVMVSGVSLEGGYDANWEKGDPTQTQYKVQIYGSFYATDSQYLAVIARNLNKPTSITDVVITAPNASGGSSARSSYGVVAINSNSLKLQGVVIQAGNGQNGNPGSAGSSASQTAAPSGNAGANAVQADYVCNDTGFGAGGAGGSVSGNRSGGNGGNGGKMDTNCGQIPYNLAATAGQAGGSAALIGAGFGTGGSGGPVCQAGGVGSPGKAVIHGTGGAAPGNYGAVVSSYWAPSAGASGSLGQDGSGGGGGGGSGGCDTGIDSWGAGGGGGGAGGVRAPSAGSGGGTGGASFGVFAVNSTLQVVDVLIQRGNGGNGGSGGAGGQGQPGGSGGPGGNPAGGSPAGGTGGAGSAGGNSGGGGGGNGGSSYGIYGSGSSITAFSVIYSGGMGGSGGSGGSSPTSPGTAGSNGTVIGQMGPISSATELSMASQARSSSPSGALAALSYDPVFVNLIFSANAATYGGGLLNEDQGCLTLANNLFIDNSVTQQGGGVYNRQSECLFLKNATLVNNSAVTAGGGFYNFNAQAQVTNSILWGNTAPNGAQVANSSTLRPDFIHSDIQGSGGSGAWDGALGQDGGGNIDADPLFTNLAQRQLGLQPHSPARNAGLNAAISGFSIDLAGGARILDGIVDMGAFEQLWVQIYLPLMVR